jgi:hypothetical protein
MHAQSHILPADTTAALAALLSTLLTAIRCPAQQVLPCSASRCAAQHPSDSHFSCKLHRRCHSLHRHWLALRKNTVPAARCAACMRGRTLCQRRAALHACEEEHCASGALRCMHARKNTVPAARCAAGMCRVTRRWPSTRPPCTGFSRGSTSRCPSLPSTTRMTSRCAYVPLYAPTLSLARVRVHSPHLASLTIPGQEQPRPKRLACADPHSGDGAPEGAVHECPQAEPEPERGARAHRAGV